MLNKPLKFNHVLPILVLESTTTRKNKMTFIIVLITAVVLSAAFIGAVILEPITRVEKGETDA